MTTREADIIRVALAMLKSGRAHDCGQTLELVLREHGEATLRRLRQSQETPPRPLWMRPSA